MLTDGDELDDVDEEGFSVFLPSLDAIAEGVANIQSGWTARQRRRRGIRDGLVSPPVRTRSVEFAKHWNGEEMA